jgi:hypothetical protein
MENAPALDHEAKLGTMVGKGNCSESFGGYTEMHGEDA